MVPESFSRRHALLLGGDDVEREHRQHRAVHGHRHRHLVERDAGEQRAHVEDGIDRDARHADVAGHARMVAVVAAVGGEIEGDRKALLPGREIAPVERVRILGGGEAGILPDGPRLSHIHGRVGAAQIRRDAGIGVEEIEPGEIVRAVDRLHRDAFRRQPWPSAQSHRAAPARTRPESKSGSIQAFPSSRRSDAMKRCAACRIGRASQPAKMRFRRQPRSTALQAHQAGLRR